MNDGCDIGRYVSACRISDDSIAACFADEIAKGEARRVRRAARAERANRIAEHKAQIQRRLAASVTLRQTIRAMYGAGNVTLQSLANTHGVTRQRIHQIIHGSK